MLDLSAITASLETTLKADATLAAAGFKVQRADYVNMDPQHAPWLGIYRTGVKYDPRTLGQGSTAWQGIITVRLIIQATHLTDPGQLEANLEGYIQAALNAVWSDPTWASTVDMLTGMEVEYSYKEDELNSLYYQWAMITLTAEAGTG